MLCLDIETRWNSTYIMLDAAFKFKKAFDLMKRDKKYHVEMDKLKGMPMDDDWEHVRVLLPFLKYFYETTLRISGSLYVTGNMYLQEICGILKMISVARDGDDFDISVMALGMKSKYDKYWGSARNINVLLFIAVILDPRRKMKFVRWAINKYFESELAIDIHAKVDTTLKELYAFYASKLTSSPAPKPSSTMNVSEVICEHGDPVGREFEETVAAEITLAHGRNDLDKYLEDNLLVVGVSFDILSWWRDNAINYEVLTLMAKDLLAMPVSTVASEFTFSMGGRVLDLFRSSLTPRMVEALVCTQDWIKSSSDHPQVEEIIEEIENIEAGILLFYFIDTFFKYFMCFIFLIFILFLFSDIVGLPPIM